MARSPMGPPSGPLFDRLVADSSAEWQRYVGHAFVRGVADGTLPLPAFKYYLCQDYLFLTHFTRAYALAIYKSNSLAEMRESAATVAALLDEASLHLRFCAGWGLSEADVTAMPEDPACMAYTRYVLDAGMRGDLLDLHAALAPCVAGYACIGHALGRAARLDGNPYRDWIAAYAGDEYQAIGQAAATRLDRLFAQRGGENRYAGLLSTFKEATRLEAEFWRMGLDRA
ncbi:MAG: thiaminase II [Alphaproteobacteria bacterium]